MVGQLGETSSLQNDIFILGSSYYDKFGEN